MYRPENFQMASRWLNAEMYIDQVEHVRFQRTLHEVDTSHERPAQSGPNRLNHLLTALLLQLRPAHPVKPGEAS